MTELSFREGGPADLRAAFEFGESAWDASRRRRGLIGPDQGRGRDEIHDEWERSRGFIEFVAAQPDGSFWICENGGEMVGYSSSSRFGVMDELTELWVVPSHAGRGIGRALLERIWPDSRLSSAQ